MLSWFLGVLRFHVPAIQTLFNVVFFPFGFFNLLIEQSAISDGVSTLLDDEIIQGVLWLIFVTLQSLFYYFLYRFLGAMRQRRLTND